MLSAIEQFLTSNLLPSDWLTGDNIAMIPLYFLAVALVISGVIQARSIHMLWSSVVTFLAGLGVGVLTYYTREYLTTMNTYPSYLHNKDERVPYLLTLTGAWVLISLVLIGVGLYINSQGSKPFTHPELKPVSYWGRLMIGLGVIMQVHTIMMTAEILDIKELAANETCSGAWYTCTSHATTNLIPTWVILAVVVAGLAGTLCALPGFVAWRNRRKKIAAMHSMPQIPTFGSSSYASSNMKRDSLL